jgi:hypothetical protein
MLSFLDVASETSDLGEDLQKRPGGRILTLTVEKYLK